MIRRFIKYYKCCPGLFVLDMVCALIVAACDLFYPMITRDIINDYIPNKKLTLVIVWCSVMALLYIFKIALNYIINYFGHVCGVYMQAQMRNDIFKHLQKLPFEYFDNNKTGTIQSRIINDLFDVSELAHHGPEDLFISVVLLVGSFILMGSINIYLTLIVFASVPAFVVFAMKKRLKLSAAFTQTRVETGEINANIENSISGIRVSKAYTNANYELERFKQGNDRFVAARKRSYKVMAEFSSGTSFITDLLNIVVMLSGAIFIYYEKIDVGDYAAFIIFVNIFMNPIRRLIGFVEQYQNGMSGFKRFCEIMDTEVEAQPSAPVYVDRLEGNIEFNNVSFSYDNKNKVLDGISFKIPKGQKVAFVGSSGGGKTTICNIIPRFYDIDGGEVTIDGINIDKMDLFSLRSNIGMVMQDVFLFTGTVYENILYGKPDATEEEVYAAAKHADIHEFILSLPDGYSTYVGERGVKLSGGQKQRISLARAFLKNPPILILDEATSALDNATEYEIKKSIDNLCKGRTTIIVAHRLTTIKNADVIYVVGENGIEEEGSHEQLMEKKGEYYNLVKSTQE